MKDEVNCRPVLFSVWFKEGVGYNNFLSLFSGVSKRSVKKSQLKNVLEYFVFLFKRRNPISL